MNDKEEKKDRLITIKEASERLGCSRGHVYNLISRGKLKRHNIALDSVSKTRVSELDLERYIRESEEPVGGAA